VIGLPLYDSKTALLVVDFQNDFADPQGSLYVSGAEDVVDRINQEIERAARAGALVVYTQDWHPRSTPHFATDGGIWPVHCVAGTWGADLYPKLDVVGAVVRKGTGGEDGYSGFSVRDPGSGEESSTGLAQMLESGGIERTVIVGLATDYCVKETALDALRLGYPVTVLEDAVRAVELAPGDGRRALDAVRAAGGRVE
jgi:nicotinamidase/pyrazinamidase